MPPLRPLVLMLVLFALAACAGQPDQPSFYRDLAQPGAKLDAAAAASMISGYRTNNGLPVVIIDPALTAMAQAQAETMAQRDKLEHNVKKPFVKRLKAAGYPAKRAAENIGAGYHTLAEAFSGWREFKLAPRQHAAGRRHPHGHRRGLYAGVEVQSVLGADPGRAGGDEGLDTAAFGYSASSLRSNEKSAPAWLCVQPLQCATS